MIQAIETVKEFDGFRALDGLNLNVKKGSVYGLVGPNGAGKSTIIRHLTGIIKQDSGEVLIDGKPIYENPEIKEKIAYIPDDIFYFTDASIKEMMRFYSSIYKNFSAERFKKLGEYFDIDPNRRMRRLSKGMQKQAAFWLALSANPEIVILDEPVDGLDPVMRRKVWSLLLQEVSERDITVLVSSHNLRELEDVCDHVGIMNKGRMLIERSLAQLQENIVKIQLAMPEGAELPNTLDIMNKSQTGRVQQLIVRGTPEAVSAEILTAKPLFMDALPLSLEEIFIYEIGGVSDEIRNIIV